MGEEAGKVSAGSAESEPEARFLKPLCSVCRGEKIWAEQLPDIVPCIACNGSGEAKPLKGLGALDEHDNEYLDEQWPTTGDDEEQEHDA